MVSVLIKTIFGKKDILSKSHVIYQTNCPVKVKDHTLPNPCYIGNTQCSLAQKIKMHVQNSSNRNRLVNDHNIAMEIIIDNVKVLHQASDDNRLFIYEALTIKFLKVQHK